MLEKAGKLNKARAVLEQSRLKNPKNDELLLAAVRLELRAQNPTAAEVGDTGLVNALKDCPTSGLLWSQAISLTPQSQRKYKCIEALKSCDDDPYVICAVAELFWFDRKVEKARRWFIKALHINPNIGDNWARYYNFELKYGTVEQKENLINNCKVAAPHSGEVWNQISKDPDRPKMTIEAILKKVADKISQKT